MKINPAPDAVKGHEIYLLRALCRELCAETFRRLGRYFKNSLHSLVQSTGPFKRLIPKKNSDQYQLSSDSRLMQFILLHFISFPN